jgi:hypothetical protein
VLHSIKGFRFESCWLLAPDFKEVVLQSWLKPVSSGNKARTLHIKLSRLAKALKMWHKQRMIIQKQESTAAQQLVLRLDQFQDVRQLTEEECRLRTEAKNKILAIAVVRRIRLRQRSGLTWIRADDANTKLFHLRANVRNHISALKHEGNTCITQEAKATALDAFFSHQFGHTNAHNHTLNWELLG